MRDLNKIFDYQNETFKPFLIDGGSNFFRKLIFSLRILIDTPHRTIINSLKKNLKYLKGNTLLDVGCGNQFYKRYIPENMDYKGIEIKETKKYFKNFSDVIYYNGKKIPFKNETFDNALCLEVLEHVYNFQNLIKEINRVLKKNGILILSVPFAAKYHYLPYDFFRYTPSSLKIILEDSSFKIINFSRRGDDIVVTFHYILVSILGLIYKKNIFSKIIGILLLPIGIFFALLNNILENFEFGAKENTIGFFIVCKKR